MYLNVELSLICVGKIERRNYTFKNFGILVIEHHLLFFSQRDLLFIMALLAPLEPCLAHKGLNTKPQLFEAVLLLTDKYLVVRHLVVIDAIVLGALRDFFQQDFLHSFVSIAFIDFLRGLSVSFLCLILSVFEICILKKGAFLRLELLLLNFDLLFFESILAFHLQHGRLKRKLFVVAFESLELLWLATYSVPGLDRCLHHQI